MIDTGATSSGPPGDLRTDPLTRRRFGRLVGVLFLIGGVTSIPSSLLLEPPPSPLIVAVTAAAILGGLLWILLPWERADWRLLHVAVALGTVIVALAVAAADLTYGFYSVIIAVYVAYAFASRAAIGAHLALLTAALLAPLVYDPSTARETLQINSLAIPNMFVAAAVVTFLRERGEFQERRFRRFAEEAQAIARRIGGSC